MKNIRKKLFIPVIGLGILAAILIVGWPLGWVGGLTARVLARFFLPYSPHETVEITECRFKGSSDLPDTGIILTIHPDRLKENIEEAYPAARKLPPGILKNLTSLRGFWTPEDVDLSGVGKIPVSIVLDRGIGWRPHLSCSFPASDFNKMVATQFAGKLTKRREYFLGHYNMSYEPTFHTLDIHSEAEIPVEPIQRRRLLVNATGRVRFWFDDDLLKARATGKVKRLTGAFDIGIIRDDEGIGISYHADISELDLSVNNLAPWGEKWLAEDLRNSMDRSINKEKKRRRFAEKRFPAWIPLDLIVEFHLTRD